MSETDDKTPRRPQARLPRGFADRDGASLAASERMNAAIREVYERYGFEALETPFLEYTDALGKFLPDQDRPNEGVFSFQDDDGQWVSLRYDLTAPLARFVAENYERIPKPYRSYRAGYVFRNEKPGPGRFRQFMQFDADIVGSGSVAADAEICMMAADTLEALGVPRGGYVIKVNNRKILDGVMEAIGLGGEENAGRRLTVLRAIDKHDRLGPAGVEALLGEGRIDESGDRTPGAGLESWQIDGIMRLLNEEPSSGIRADSRRLSKAEFEDKWGEHPAGWFDRLNQERFAESIQNLFEDWLGILGSAPKIFHEGIAELREIQRLYSQAGYEGDRIQGDVSVVRGLEYYTGPVFEAELTFEVKDENGRPVRFGSVGGGGRYDGLVGRFRGEDVPATGFSIGVSRLLAALQAVKSPIVAGAAAKPLVIVTAMDRDRMADYQAMAASLRAAGLRAEVYLGAAGFGAQMKYADRRAAACAIIQGSSEKETGTVQIKDLALGARLAAMGRDAKDRAEYLELQAKAQFAVPEGEMVEAVKRVIAGQG